MPGKKLEIGQRLTKDDVALLLTDPSADARTKTAQKVAGQFNQGGLSGDEQKIAEDIFRLMVADAEVRVRSALADNLKENKNIPYDVAKKLAMDVEEVSLPIIQFSDVLKSEDLIEIVRSQSEAKQIAVASRPNLEEKVSAVIAEEATENAVAALASNEQAAISEKSMQKMVDRFGTSEKVQTPLVLRQKLPIAVSERLVFMVSEKLQDHLLTHHELPPDVAANLVLQSREKATVNLSAQSSEMEVEELVKQLRTNGRLTSSIIVRSLCMGDLKFFEYAFSELTGIPIKNARLLIHDSGTLGLKGLFEKTRFPKNLYPIVRAALQILSETQFDGGENDRARFSRRMIERILTYFDETGIAMYADDIEYLLGKMNELPATEAFADEHA